LAVSTNAPLLQRYVEQQLLEVGDAGELAAVGQLAAGINGLAEHEAIVASRRAALVNAVAHRDYSMAGARVRLHMFGDRIEFYVPGGLANTLTPDSMSLRQYSRNELIVSLLARCPVDADEGLGRSYLMDRRGDGVPIILAESERLSGRAPEYSVIDDSELRLVIWAAGEAATPAGEQQGHA
jgi:hypothetical protein